MFPPHIIIMLIALLAIGALNHDRFIVRLTAIVGAFTVVLAGLNLLSLYVPIAAIFVVMLVNFLSHYMVPNPRRRRRY